MKKTYSFSLDSQSYRLFGGHLAGDHLLNIGKEGALGLRADGVLHRGADLGQLGVGLRRGLLQTVQADGTCALDQRRDLGLDKGANISLDVSISTNCTAASRFSGSFHALRVMK